MHSKGDKGQVSENKTCLISLLPSGSIFYKGKKNWFNSNKIRDTSANTNSVNLVGDEFF